MQSYPRQLDSSTLPKHRLYGAASAQRIDVRRTGRGARAHAYITSQELSGVYACIESSPTSNLAWSACSGTLASACDPNRHR